MAATGAGQNVGYRWALGDPGDLTQEIVGQGQAGCCGPTAQDAVHLVGDVAHLNGPSHHRDVPAECMP